MKTGLSKRFWSTLIIFSLLGQVAWVVENMYFNVFVYKMFHASANDISVMVAASAVSATLTTLLVGAFSDRVGKRKIFICLGYLFWGASILSFAVIRMDVIRQFIPEGASVVTAASVGVTIVIVMDCVMTFFGSAANDACFNAWLTDKTDLTNRGGAEGINAMMPLVAMLTVFGGFMFFDLDNQESWVIIYGVIGIAVILIGILGFFLIEDSMVKTDRNKNYFGNILYGFRPSVMKKNPVLYVTLGAFAFFGISIQIIMPYLILYYEKSLGMSNYVLILAPAIILASIITGFYGRVYDKFRFKNAIIPAILILMSGYACLYLSRGIILVFTGSLLMMIGYLTGMAVFGAMVRDHTPEDKTGLFQGIRIIGQVLIPGMIGPAIGAKVLANAKTTLNGDGTVSFIPNKMIFLAALAATICIWGILFLLFNLIKNEHYDLLTEEGEKITDTPWQEYPRPQMRRDSYLNLNGKWDLAVTKNWHIPEKFPMQILVPFPPESILSGIHKRIGKFQNLYYKKTFILPEGFTKDRVLLHFGAVDQIATVYINGEEIITHTGGYLPFTADITKYLYKNEENVLIVKARDTLSHELPYGKQKKKRGGMWYTQVSGIWQTVWMESVPDTYIRELKITPTLHSVTIGVDCETTGSDTSFTKEIVVKTETGNLHKKFSDNEITIEIENPRLWSPEDPYLYEFEVRTQTDTVSSYFALRTLNIKEVNGYSRLCLNDKPYFFHGLLDQGYFSDGIYLPAEENNFYKDIAAMKELGFNTLRKHIKVEPVWYYYLCDKLGMIVFQDMPNNGNYSFLRDTGLPTLGFVRLNDSRVVRKKAVKDNFTKSMLETVQHLYNFPSICYWSIFNEGWGQFESDEMYERVKSFDNTRFIDSTSGWFWQKKSDVSSLHVYFRPVTVKNEGRPVVVSEFGGYSYKIPEHSYNLENTYGYKFYASQSKFQKELVQLYTREIASQIKNGLCASIYTQVSDVEDETNGLFTYDRRVLKVDKEEMLKLAEKLTNHGMF